jgi:hypothetical protein
VPPLYPKRHTGELHIRKHDLYTDAYSDSNGNTYSYCYIDRDGDANSNTSTQIYTDPAGPPHASSTPIGMS